jgi:hypothetical protein
MGVFVRGLILTGLLCAFAPGAAHATPLLIQSSSDVEVKECGLIVANDANCQLFSLGSLLESTVLDLTFASSKDVALLEFTIAADSDFLALTSSPGLDTMLGLFDATGVIYQYQNPDFTDAFGANITDSNLDDQLGGFALTAETSYYLAVLLDMDPAWTNGFTGDPESLSQGFACDADECLGSGGRFRLTLSAISNEQPEPVPEPGTLTLIAGGALARLIQRRSSKKRNRSKSISR